MGGEREVDVAVGAPPEGVEAADLLRAYGKVDGQCAAEGVDHPGYLLRLSELELLDRHHRIVDRRVRAVRFPAVESLDTLDFLAIPSVNKHLVMQLARCEYVDRRENVTAIGNGGTGKTQSPSAWGSPPVKGAVGRIHRRCFAGPRANRGQGRATTAQPAEEAGTAQAAYRRQARLRPTLAQSSPFEVFSQRYERGSVLVTTNLPFGEWTEVFGSERLTGALLDRLTHRVHILEMNAESYRLRHSRQAAAVRSAGDSPNV